MLKPQTAWAASLPLFLLRRCSRSTPKPTPACGRRLPFLPVCKRRMSAQAQPRFASLPSEEPESDAGAAGAGYQFRLVSYNILAQVYVKSAFFPHSPSACLKWKSRSKAVLTELKSFDADLMCVQELDEYDTFYKKNMESSGYSSIYVQRSGDKRDGCGIFYKPKSAELVQKEGIHYNDLVEKYAPSNHVNSAPSNNSAPEEETSAPIPSPPRPPPCRRSRHRRRASSSDSTRSTRTGSWRQRPSTSASSATATSSSSTSPPRAKAAPRPRSSPSPPPMRSSTARGPSPTSPSAPPPPGTAPCASSMPRSRPRRPRPPPPRACARGARPRLEPHPPRRLPLRLLGRHAQTLVPRPPGLRPHLPRPRLLRLRRRLVRAPPGRLRLRLRRLHRARLRRAGPGAHACHPRPRTRGSLARLGQVRPLHPRHRLRRQVHPRLGRARAAGAPRAARRPQLRRQARPLLAAPPGRAHVLLARYAHHTEFVAGIDMSVLVDGLLASAGWDEMIYVWPFGTDPRAM